MVSVSLLFQNKDGAWLFSYISTHPAITQLRTGLELFKFLSTSKFKPDFDQYLTWDDEKCVNAEFMKRQLLDKICNIPAAEENQIKVKQWTAHALTDITGTCIFDWSFYLSLT